MRSEETLSGESFLSASARTLRRVFVYCSDHRSRPAEGGVDPHLLRVGEPLQQPLVFEAGRLLSGAPVPPLHTADLAAALDGVATRL
jgi:hypothetical protein